MDAPTPDKVVAFLDKANTPLFEHCQFHLQARPRPQGAFYVFVTEETKVSDVLKSWLIPIILFLQGSDAAVEILKHPFFAKVGREPRTSRIWIVFQYKLLMRVTIFFFFTIGSYRKFDYSNSQAVNSVLLVKKDQDGFGQNSGDQEKVSKGESAAQRLGQAHLVAVPSRYSMWRPPLGGEIRNVTSSQASKLR